MGTCACAGAYEFVGLLHRVYVCVLFFANVRQFHRISREDEKMKCRKICENVGQKYAPFIFCKYESSSRQRNGRSADVFALDGTVQLDRGGVVPPQRKRPSAATPSSVGGSLVIGARRQL